MLQCAVPLPELAATAGNQGGHDSLGSRVMHVAMQYLSVAGGQYAIWAWMLCSSLVV